MIRLRPNSPWSNCSLSRGGDIFASTRSRNESPNLKIEMDMRPTKKDLSISEVVLEINEQKVRFVESFLISRKIKTSGVTYLCIGGLAGAVLMKTGGRFLGQVCGIRSTDGLQRHLQ